MYSVCHLILLGASSGSASSGSSSNACMAARSPSSPSAPRSSAELRWEVSSKSAGLSVSSSGCSGAASS